MTIFLNFQAGSCDIHAQRAQFKIFAAMRVQDDPCTCFFLFALWSVGSGSTQTIQSGPQVQKSEIFSHSVISLNQLLQNSINNTANIFLTFRNHVKIFLSPNIMQKC